MPYGPIDFSLAAAAPGTAVGTPLTNVGETLADYRTEVLLDLGNRTDLTNPQLDKWINQGYRYIAGMIDLKELWGSVDFILEADQPFYQCPDSLMWFKRLSLQDDANYPFYGGREMEQIDLEEYRMLPESDEVQVDGADLPPTKYMRYNRVLVVYPTPLSAFTATADFRVRVSNLEDTTDSPILPEEFHEAIGRAAVWRAKRNLRMFQEAAMAQNDMVSLLRPLLNSDAEERISMNFSAQPLQSRFDTYRKDYY
jgi:hypothetical protein